MSWLLGGLNCVTTPFTDPLNANLKQYCDFAYEQYVQIGVMVFTYIVIALIFGCYMGVGYIGKLITEDWGIYESWVETIDQTNEDMGTSLQYWPSMLAQTKTSNS